MFQPAIVERLGYDLADRRQHSILAAQCVACGATICRLEHTFEVAPRHFGIADAQALRDFLDHGLGMLGLELLMIPDENDPVPRLYGHCQFARRATRRFIDDDEIEGCRRQAERRAPKPDTSSEEHTSELQSLLRIS